jgi:glycosyltransferase involved in cell wall biosynthesis
VRILQVVPYYEDAWAYGGIPRLVSALARGLVRRGHDVTVCTTDVADERSRLDGTPRDRAGVNVRVFRNVSNRLAYHYQFFTPVGLWRFLRQTAQAFDIGHLHACHNLPGVLAATALGRANVPYLVSPNGTAPRIERRRLAKLAFDLTVGRRVLPDAARVLAVSIAERDHLQALGIDANRLRVVPNPIEESEFASAPDSRGFRAAHGLGAAPVVLFLGKLSPRKGVDVLIRAFAQLARPEARLVIAGNDMGAAPSALTLARALGLSDRFVRIGLLRGEHRLAALAASDVVVYPSRDEVFGLVPVEALMCERPVIVCSDSGCGEVVSRLGGGHIVPYGDPGALAGAIDAILGDPDTWRRRARLAGVRARQTFGADVVCSQLEAVYREVLASRALDGRGAA